MTKHRTVDARDRSRPSAAPRRRRTVSVARPRTGALAAVGIGLLLLVGAGQAVAPRVSESGAGELAYALWSNPVPSFLAVAGRGATTQARGLVPADPPRALGVPDTTGTAREGGGGTRASGASTGAAPSSTVGGGAPTSTVASSVSAVSQAPGTPATGVPIRVYFSRHPASDATFTAVSPVKRWAPDRGVATAALAELIDGPTTDERAAGYYSELGRSLSGPSTCDGRDFQLSIRDGVATVRFCRAMTSAGIGQDARVRAQIEATLTQFSTIRSVRLLGADGHCLFDESGQDRCLAGATPTPQSPRTGAPR